MVAHAAVDAQAVDLHLHVDVLHLVVAVADAEASAAVPTVVAALTLVVDSVAAHSLAVAVAQHTRLFHVAFTFQTVRKFRFLTQLQ